MREITDADRKLFATLTDEQIASIIVHDDELEEETARAEATMVEDLDARMLRAFGYQGLCDYLDRSVGTHYLTALEMEQILSRFERFRYAESVAMRSTILAATESSSSSNAERKRRTVQEMMQPLED